MRNRKFHSDVTEQCYIPEISKLTLKRIWMSKKNVRSFNFLLNDFYFLVKLMTEIKVLGSDAKF